MEFKRRELRVKVYGEEYSLTFPTVKQSQDYAAKVKEMKESEATEALLEFVDNLGLPKDVSENMESEHLSTLIEALVPNKKK